MDSMQKMMSSSANLRKSLGIMNEHSSALQTFAQEYPNLQDAYMDATTLGQISSARRNWIEKRYF